LRVPKIAAGLAVGFVPCQSAQLGQLIRFFE
jgi:hypothetical protein